MSVYLAGCFSVSVTVYVDIRGLCFGSVIVLLFLVTPHVTENTNSA